ncbi:hypothetical protein LTR56_027747 [Elasticomyces elasticus]|nr:hypothetical protein LTR56_027747 [Elasticomyces elasticus]
MEPIPLRKRPAQSPREPRNPSKSRRIEGDAGSQGTKADVRKLLHAADNDTSLSEAVNTPSQPTYVGAIREVLGGRALPKEEIMKEVLERRTEFFPNKSADTVRAGLHTTFSNHSKSKDPKIREWAREYIGERGRTTTVWACAEVNLQGGTESSAIECAPTPAGVDGTPSGAAAPGQSPLRTSTPQGPSTTSHSSNVGPTGSTQPNNSPRTYAPLTSWRPGGTLDHESGQERHSHHSDSSKTSEGDSTHTTSRLQSNTMSSAAGLDETDSSARMNGQEATSSPTNVETVSTDPQLLSWGHEVSQIRKMASRLEEMKASTTTLSEQEQALQAEMEAILARATHLEKEIQETHRQLKVVSEAAKKTEVEVKKRTTELLGLEAP